MRTGVRGYAVSIMPRGGRGGERGRYCSGMSQQAANTRQHGTSGGAGGKAGGGGAAAAGGPVRVTLAGLRKRSEPFASLTCYDATTARWLARAGVPVLLVGDTAAEMTLGFGRTLEMPLEVLLALTAGVKRGAQSVERDFLPGGAGPERWPGAVVPLVMGDMPFMSYHTGEGEAVRNAGRFLTEGLADVVKLEVDAGFAPLVAKMASAGIPVCGHIGSRPQRAAITGYSAAGRTAAEADAIVRDAAAMQAAGVVMMLVEAVPEAVAARIKAEISVPLIGIGAGNGCEGQVLVLHDLLGLTDRQPAFAPPAADAAGVLVGAAQGWVKRVAAREVPASPYSMR